MVIKSFGTLITQGNIVIGILIFLIIVLVQFIVITKGAERVSEVAARFTLDAMPGKQMAIDADLSSGLIDEKEARLRRYKIQKEADFYGAMDGATKIVKGDAVMSLIITVINFVAGLIIGIVQGGGDLATVLNQYSIATIGDGLVSQLPALMISTATGMIVTRSVSDGSLNSDVLGQFKAQPRAILATGIILALLGLVPGAPTAPLLLVGCGLGRGPGCDGLVRRLLDLPRPLVLDADGINALSGHMDALSRRRDRITVLTPHEGEFVRAGGDLSPGRERAAADFAREHGVYLVLKGPGTIAAAPDGRCMRNPTGNCGMAKGGSGDVLAGMLVSLLGLGLAPMDACCAAVWLHGRAGDLAAREVGLWGMTPSDLLDRIPAALREVTE